MDGLPRTKILNIITAKLIFRILSSLVSQCRPSGTQIFLDFLELLDFVSNREESLRSDHVFDIVEVLLKVYSGLDFHSWNVNQPCRYKDEK